MCGLKNFLNFGHYSSPRKRSFIRDSYLRLDPHNLRHTPAEVVARTFM